jgi:tetratricopeptide (TPR) repeat protein
VPTRAYILAVSCMVAAADTGAQTNTWRQCFADTSPAAIEACTAIIFLDPRNDGAFVNRGIAHRRVGDLERAVRDYDEAIRLNPRAADAFNNRGNAFRDLDDFARAIRDYDEAIRLNPGYAQAYSNRGIISLELGDLDRAIVDFDRAIEEDPAYANAFRNRGIARTEQNQFDLAIKDFDEAFRLDPSAGRGNEYALALYGRGIVRERDGDSRGREDVEHAKRLLPNVAEVMAEEESR